MSYESIPSRVSDAGPDIIGDDSEMTFEEWALLCADWMEDARRTNRAGLRRECWDRAREAFERAGELLKVTLK